jgi:hypothetical protein
MFTSLHHAIARDCGIGIWEGTASSPAGRESFLRYGAAVSRTLSKLLLTSSSEFFPIQVYEYVEFAAGWNYRMNTLIGRQRGDPRDREAVLLVALPRLS